MSNKVMKITMLGGMSITWGDNCILQNSARMNKSFELLALLLLRPNSLSNEQLMECLWYDEDIANPAGALKNTAYILRRFFQQADPDLQFILSERGRYFFNPEIPLELDVHTFEHNAKLVQEHLSTGQSTSTSLLNASMSGVGADLTDDIVILAKKTLASYAGDLLPGMSFNQWVMQYNTTLRKLYLETVYSLVNLLKNRGSQADYHEILDICNRAVLSEPLSNRLYISIFDAMRNLDMKRAVINFYPVISNMFFDELGERLPSEIREVFLWASEGSNTVEENLRQIQQDLVEVTRDARPIRGAYYCEYEMFSHMYHMVARSAVRSSSQVALMLVTLSPKGNITTGIAKNDLVTAMFAIRDLVKNALRKGDVFSRYSRNQYILMVSVAKFSDCGVVKSRILACFNKLPCSKKIEMSINEQGLDPIA